jgi:hypothetical protein
LCSSSRLFHPHLGADVDDHQVLAHLDAAWMGSPGLLDDRCSGVV